MTTATAAVPQNDQIVRAFAAVLNPAFKQGNFTLQDLDHPNNLYIVNNFEGGLFHVTPEKLMDVSARIETLPCNERYVRLILDQWISGTVDATTRNINDKT